MSYSNSLNKTTAFVSTCVAVGVIAFFVMVIMCTALCQRSGVKNERARQNTVAQCIQVPSRSVSDCKALIK